MSDLYRYNMGDPSFGNIHFAGTLRPSQVEASSVIREQLDKEGKGAAGKTSQEMKKKTKKLFKAKGGGLAEATAKLKAKGFSEGGAVVKDKIVSIDTSPNSGLITVKGFGAGRRT